MFPIFSEPQSTTKFPSKLPISWRVSHILLCLTGVNNVYFITSLPTSIRLTSLIYHAACLCLSIPLFVLYTYGRSWERSVTNIVQQVGMIISNSYILTLGTVFMFNALKRNRTSKFLRNWHLLGLHKTIFFEDGEAKCCTRVRTVLLISTIFQLVSYVTFTVRSFLIADLSTIASDLFYSLGISPEVFKVLCGIYIVLTSFSAFNVALTACHFALVTISLADEFDKLYRVICKLLSSSGIGIDVWEQVRFHHKALMSLARLHSRLSTMILGPILIGYVTNLCFTFYFVLVLHVGVTEVSNITFAVVMLWAIIAPSNLLGNRVSNKCLSHQILPHVINK